MTQPAPTANPWRLPGRVAYVVNHALPYSADGYAVRTHEVAQALGQLGHDVRVIVRPGRPWDIEGFPPGTEVAPDQTVDGVRYLFLPMGPPETGAGSLRARLRQAEKVLLQAFEVIRPGAVIGVSNWENAEPALYAARRWGAPFFYEQRGFWEMSQAEKDPAYAGSAEAGNAREVETRIAREARGVFTLNQGMADTLAARGVPAEKIALVPNGVAKPARPAAPPSRASLGITAKRVLGYVGSLSAYEGVEDLLEVLSRLRRAGVDAALLVVGSDAPKGLVEAGRHAPDAAPAHETLAAAAAAQGLAGHVHTTGQVPRSAVDGYYPLLDAVVMPRRRSPVTELVAPLKPYAAAAHGLPVFMPDLPALRAVAGDIHGSLYPEGDLEALTQMLRQTLEEGGHPAVLNPLPSRVAWRRRVAPMAQALRAAAEATPAPPFAQTGAPAPSGAPAAAQGRFDLQRLPRVALRRAALPGPIAAIGPAAGLEGEVTPLSRANLLGHLATLPVGRFVIDWAGLQAEPGEWRGLWSIENMRLNRQILDATAIAQDRGWRCEVIGPIARARAPLFRTVAGAFTEIAPGAQAEAAP